jgi:hypothetical protein
MGFRREQPSDDAALSPYRLAEILSELDHFREAEMEALLTAMTSAAWPSPAALRQ